ncbi:CapA family protein [Nostocoides vanveenii]|uniref:CapA family protein n=1 Tax=Nostocoides vanveenii TaxID=330835 RepID=A0ABP4WR11_9MICO
MGVIHRSALAAAALAVGLAACTGGGSGSGGTAGARTRHTSSGMGSDGPSDTPTPSTPEPVSITIGASGDLLTHVAVRRSAEAYAGRPGHYDFSPMFAKVAPLIKGADLSLCHLETPLTSTDTNLSRPGILVFNTPHELADGAVAAGYKGCDFASNHTWDQGLAGLKDTIGVFTSVGLGYAGPGASAKDPIEVARYDVGGVKVAHLGFTYTIYNNWGPNTDVPPEAPWLADALWPATGAEGIIRDAKQARADGADIVVVSLHWGQEYVAEPTPDQSELAKALLDSPEVDLILGTHVHRVQPCQVINGKYVFYGLGNFLSNQSPQVDASLLPQTQEGMFAQVTITRDADGTVTSSAAYQPTQVNLAGHVIEPATKAGNPTTFDRVTKVLTSLGDCPLTPLTP